MNTIKFKVQGATAGATTVDIFGKQSKVLNDANGKPLPYQQTASLNPGLYNVPSKKNPLSVNTYEVTEGIAVRQPKTITAKASKKVTTMASAVMAYTPAEKAAFIALLSK